MRVLYASCTGTAVRLAESLRKQAFALRVGGWHVSLTLTDLGADPAAWAAEDGGLEAEAARGGVIVLLLPSWSGGKPSPGAVPLCTRVHELACDFRVSKDALSGLSYALFGLGCADYGADWCRAALELGSDLDRLGAFALAPTARGDDSGDMDAQFSTWCDALLPPLAALYEKRCGAPAVSAPATTSSLESGAGGGCGCGLSSQTAVPVAPAAGPCACGRSSSCSVEALAEPVGASATSAAALATATPVLRRRDLQQLRASLPAEERAAFDAARRAVLASAAHSREPMRVAASAAAAAAAAASAEAAAAASLEPNEEDLLNDEMLADGSVPADGSRSRAGSAGGGLADVEDLGSAIRAAAEDQRADSAAKAAGVPPREMLTPAQRRALTKEGYQLIGSHSAVKTCRWTKAQLRGRGGCYKHTFYGIDSHRCMEATPSLACANKCVFCWRHHKNPVGREWRWAVDDPAMIVAEALAKHGRAVAQLRDLPGVDPARYAEAVKVRHCALSLVGEPIFYPRIGELVRALHARRISTFLVTNAQFPDALISLPPVTQLYVSVDAATRETLRAIDRPLFADFWERFLAALDALRARRQRTVFRLTLVKGENMREIDEYSALVVRGAPDFIEVKGVTWCGESPGSSLTMANVPWHADVRAFCETLAARTGGEYGLAAEHAHSCCVLLAKNAFRGAGGIGWRTHIDYEAFFDRFDAWAATGADFGSEDYAAPTPAWAEFGAAEAGFDPAHTRHYRNRAQRKGGVIVGADIDGGGNDGSGGDGETRVGAEEVPYEPSESGCG